MATHDEKHVQLGTDLAADDRRPMTAEEKRQAWAHAQTPEQAQSEWDELAADAAGRGLTTEEYGSLWS